MNPCYQPKLKLSNPFYNPDLSHPIHGLLQTKKAVMEKTIQPNSKKYLLFETGINYNFSGRLFPIRLTGNIIPGCAKVAQISVNLKARFMCHLCEKINW